LFGFIPSPPDYRDCAYGKMIPLTVPLPSEFTLEDKYRTPIRDQGTYGTCVGHAAVSVKELQEALNYPSQVISLSPLFVYRECKQVDGIPTQEGTYPRTAMDVLRKKGVCKENTLPYSQLKDIKQLPTPPKKAYEEAKDFIIGAYARIQTIDELKQAIYRDGPVLAGIMVYENFITPGTGGFIKIPEGKWLGNHAVAAVGWNDNLTYAGYKGFIRVRNSWGASWGDKGYCWIPYDFFNGKTDIGMPYWVESWSSVDVILPPKKAKKIVLWVDKNEALVDGQKVILDAPPVVDPKLSRTLVPLRFIAENFGYRVIWDSSSKQITIIGSDDF